MKKNKLILSGVASFAAVLGLAAAVPAVHAAPTVDNSELPQNTSTTMNDKTGSVSAKSNAHVAVQTGYLSLNSVPDLNFAPTSQSDSNQTQGLLNNNTGARQSAISITDSRNTKDAQNGWTLDAALGQFNNEAGQAAANPAAWAINLNNTNYTNSQGSRVNINSNARITAGGQGANVITATDGQGLGNTTVDYGRQGKDVASLVVPAGTTPGAYDAPITWTLAAGTPTNPTN
ncbi:WxL domain-containing protein [Fructilactobacillus myrtifloralis]|uniref:WxL domain-containing protein n=1 Tax=Fructilactobacillus myrtifloralis TaxID=2940301 RepID=A0ABY5BMA9_9LACO|nr:WxL domain-containing protein [Fructilactobacillus myrtifloralis]USS84710.1 WxL domain-containing protein [Fructilactobacillus myrtifloralis]